MAEDEIRQRVPGGPVAATDRDEVLAVASDVMERAGHCALVTLADDGRPAVRAMDPFPPEKDLRVWMATNPATRKVRQLQQRPGAALYYLDPDGDAYVVLHGVARLVDDDDERRARWKPEWDEYYPGGPLGDAYLLVEFRPDRVEVVSHPHGVASAPDAWQPAIVDLEATLADQASASSGASPADSRRSR